jgi:hypothetical protein
MLLRGDFASLLPGMWLVTLLISLYLFAAPAKSGVGIGTPDNLIDDMKFLCVVRFATPQWWAGRGHRKMRRFR